MECPRCGEKNVVCARCSQPLPSNRARTLSFSPEGHININYVKNLIVTQRVTNVYVDSRQTPVRVSVVDDPEDLQAASDDVLILTADWEADDSLGRRATHSASASSMADDEHRQPEVVITRMIGTTERLYYDVNTAINEDRSIPSQIVQGLYRKFHLRLIALTKRVEFVMQVDHRDVKRVLGLQHEVQDQLAHLLLMNREVTWESFSRPPTQCTEDITTSSAIFHQFSEGELRLILVGGSEVGKSSCGNSILGQNQFDVGRRPALETETCVWGLARRNDISIQVTDTPGLRDTRLLDTDLHKEFVKCFATVAPGPHAILMVLDRFLNHTSTEYRAYETLKQRFGERVTEFMIVVFTGLDWFEDASFDEELRNADPLLKQILDDVHWRYIGFNNSLPMSERILQGDRLIQRVAEMTRLNRGGYYTNEQIETCERIIQADMTEGRSRKKIKQAILRESGPFSTNSLFSVASSNCSLM